MGPLKPPTPAPSTSLVLLYFRFYLIYSILFSHTAPGGPPIDARTIGLSSDRLTLSWLPPDPELRNGIIIKYFICLRVVSTSPGPCLREMTHVLGRQVDPITKFTVSELKPYTKYGLNISAGTVVGFGPSASVVATTLETGNFLFLTALQYDRSLKIPKMLRSLDPPPPPKKNNNKKQEIATLLSI